MSNEPANDLCLICSYTKIAMKNPVVAEDGMPYEEAAILGYFDRMNEGQTVIRSPATGEMMGTDIIQVVGSLKSYLSQNTATQANIPERLPVCPLTLSTPLNPVLANDGVLYDGNAFSKYCALEGGELVTSPATRQLIGRKVQSLPWFEEHIGALVANNMIDGSLVDEWKEYKLLQKARGGDPDAMCQVGQYHYDGHGMFNRNHTEAFWWCDHARKAGNALAGCLTGKMRVDGEGVQLDESRGYMELAYAAGKGVDLAAYWLGFYRAFGGSHLESIGGGHAIDHEEAVLWLELALSEDCPIREMNDSQKENCRAVLADVNNGVQSHSWFVEPVANNMIDWSLVDEWKEYALLQKALGGDPDAMCQVGQYYYYGHGMFNRNHTEAFWWCDHARKEGNALSWCLAGKMRVLGEGVQQDESRGYIELAYAAGKGVDLAACWLGFRHAGIMSFGGRLEFVRDGHAVDDAEAVLWLELALSEDWPIRNMNDSHKEDCRGLLVKAKEWANNGD